MVSYGKIGTAGSVKTKEFDTEEACQKECEKLIQSKLKKGYVFDSSSQGVIKETAFTEDEFWEMIDKCKQRGSDIEEQMEWLTSCLSKKAVKDIVMFDYTFNQIYEKSYTSDLWAAAYIVMGGCSDDSFDYFRAWVVYLGKETYQTALENPEILLPYLKNLQEQEEIPELEDLLSVACLAYEEKTGLDDDQYYQLYNQLTNDDYKINPEIELDWDEDDSKVLSIKFPKLWEAFGENPLG
jgi:hypothetical protein